MKENLKFEARPGNPAAAKLRLVHPAGSPRRESPPAPDTPLLARQSLLRDEVTSRLLGDDCPTAAAFVFACPDGATELSLVGVEPEQAEMLADGLEQLASRLRLHAKRRSVRPKIEGSASIATIAALAFAAMTYINDIAWLDAALSVAAQITTAWLGRSRKRARRYPHADQHRAD
jgi:hypothetical protein